MKQHKILLLMLKMQKILQILNKKNALFENILTKKLITKKGKNLVI